MQHRDRKKNRTRFESMETIIDHRCVSNVVIFFQHAASLLLFLFSRNLSPQHIRRETYTRTRARFGWLKS